MNEKRSKRRMKTIKEELKKGMDINNTEFGKLHLAITDDNSYLLKDYLIEIKIKELKKKGAKEK